MNDYERQPMQDLAAERAVLGSVLLNQAVIEDVLKVVTAEKFYKPAHQNIFSAAVELHRRGEPGDAPAVAALLTERGELKRAGDLTYLHDLTAEVANPLSASHHAQTVYDRWLRREGRNTLTSFDKALDPQSTDPSDLEEIFVTWANKLLALVPSSNTRPRSPHLAEIPEYPAGAVPGPLGDLVTVGIQRGLDAALVGGAGLGALSSVCGSARVETRPGQKPESPALWVPLGGEPGAGKSPAMHLAFEELYELEDIAHQVYEQELEDWESEPPKSRGPRPVSRARINDDATIEVVARWLKVSDGYGGLVVDELTGWIGSIGRYRSGGTDGGERARHLSLWDGSPWKFQRVTAGLDLRINNPALTVCGGIQPENYPLLGPESDGMRPRWLPHLATTGVSEWVEGGNLAPWKEALGRLYKAVTPRTWGLDERALKALVDATARWRQLSQDASSGPSVAAAAKKGERQATRIALALAESMDPGGLNSLNNGMVRPLIGVEEMDAAIRLVDYVLACWEAMPGHNALTLSRREESLSHGVDVLAAWLEGREDGCADRRTIQLAKVAGARTSEVLNALLTEYEAVYPGSVAQARLKKTGPPTTVVYAPRRGPLRHPEGSTQDPAGTVDANSSWAPPNRHTSSISTGQSVAGPGSATVDTANSSRVYSSGANSSHGGE